MILGMCADCKCCPAEVKAGDDAICWKCDEGVMCSAKVKAVEVAWNGQWVGSAPPVRVDVLPGSEPVAAEEEVKPVPKNAQGSARVSGQGKRISEEVRAKVLSYPPEVSHTAIGRQLNISDGSVGNIRNAAGMAARAVGRSRQHPEMVAEPPLNWDEMSWKKESPERQKAGADGYPPMLGLGEAEMDRLWARCCPEQKARIIGAAFSQLLQELL